MVEKKYLFVKHCFYHKMLRKKVVRHENVKARISFNPLIRLPYEDSPFSTIASPELSRREHVDNKKCRLQTE